MPGWVLIGLVENGMLKKLILPVLAAPEQVPIQKFPPMRRLPEIAVSVLAGCVVPSQPNARKENAYKCTFHGPDQHSILLQNILSKRDRHNGSSSRGLFYRWQCIGMQASKFTACQ